MDAAASVTINPKIRDAKTAQNELTKFVKNPPTSPVEAVKQFADMTGVTGSVTASLGNLIPGFSTVLPALSGILELFGSSGPSMAEITLDVIQEGFTQVGKQIDGLKKELDEKIDVSRALTISGILSGVDAVARETVALDIFAAINETNSLIDADLKKLDMYSEYANELKAVTEKAYSQIQATVNDAREKADAEWQAMAKQIENMVLNLSGNMLSALNNFLGESPPVTQAESDAGPIVETTARVIADDKKPDSLVLVALGVAAIGAYLMTKSKKR